MNLPYETEEYTLAQDTCSRVLCDGSSRGRAEGAVMGARYKPVLIVNRKTLYGKTALTYARIHNLPGPDVPGANRYRKLPQRAASVKTRIDRTDDPAAVVKLLRQPGATE